MFRLLAKSGNRPLYALLRVAVCCLALISCGGGDLPVEPKDHEAGQLSILVKLSKVAAASISRAEIVVTGTDMTEIRQDLTVQGDTVTGVVTDIPAGGDRLFTLNGYDASGLLTYSGSATAAVIAGQKVTVRITLRPTGVTGSEKEITVTLPGGAKMEFVWIEPGTFLMGSPSSVSADENELPQHQVTITQGFYLGKYEVTQGQWEVVTGQAQWEGRGQVQVKPNNPAVYLSWDNVQAFISYLNSASGDSLYRLPTEAEWEYACRAGTTTRYSFGEEESALEDYAWTYTNTFEQGAMYAHTAGAKKPNPWGLYDMYGNVFELCQDWYVPYADAAQVDPLGPQTGVARVVRGGAFTGGPYYSAVRFTRGQEYNPTSDIGVRLVRMRNTP